MSLGGFIGRAAGRARRARRIAEHRRLQRRLAGPRLLRTFADAYPRAFFVEVGANDGVQHDHLRPYILSRDWSGIMVEPVPYVFERLRRNYGHLPRVALENVAIADRDGELPFFHLAEPAAGDLDRLPDWFDGTGSFSRAAVAGHARHIPDIEERIVETRVPTSTFDSLCRRHGDPVVDLLVVDTEGHDLEVLRSIDFARHRPRLVVYEHFHLSAGDRAASRARLEDAGYETLAEGFDTWCLRPQDDALTQFWRRLEPAVPGVHAHA